MAKNLSKHLICPVCGESKPWGDMVKHMAYAGDARHRQWCIDHDLPVDIPFGHLNKYKPNFRVTVVKECLS